MREVDYLRHLLRKARAYLDDSTPITADALVDIRLLLQEIDDATAEHEENCGIYDDGQCTCPRPPQPQDTARCSYATPAATQIVYLEKRKAELEEALAAARAQYEDADRERIKAQAEVVRLTARLRQEARG